MQYAKNGMTFKFHHMAGNKAIWLAEFNGMHFAYVGTAAVIRALRSN